jgi:GT2 family glycosyltransferase
VTPRVSVVIPTWNGRELLEICLPSLERQTFRDFETIAVDGGSTDGSVEWLRAEYPDVRVVELEENRGFAAAVNRGIEAARGEVIVLLNNDTEAEPDWLEALVAATDRDPDAGVFASRVLQYHHRDRIDSAGDKLGLLADQIGHGLPDGPEYREPRYVISACAAAAAYRREVFDRVGLFDERFVSYLEDVDIGVRAAYAGFRTLYVPDAVIYHMGSVTAARMNHTKIRLLLRNSLFLFFQYMPPSTLLRWGPFMLAWPFAYALRSRVPVRLAAGAIVGLVRYLPAVLGRRRAVRGEAALDDGEIRRLLSPPVGSAVLPAPAGAEAEGADRS